ncbi:MAG: glycosyltransferase [Saprospiraceae bacterium]|nr:glycosyltransferase [Saprospiraceae bacterium]
MAENNRKLHIVHLGISGFPFGLGAMQRLILISRGLVSAGAQVVVINRKGRYPKGQYEPLLKEGTYMKVPYKYVTASPYRPSGLLERNLHKLKGYLNELRMIRRKRKDEELDVVILYILGEIHLLLYYFLLSRVWRFPIVLNYVELNSSFPNRSFWQRLNDRIFDRFSPKLADGFIPISNFLQDHIAQYAPDAPQIRMPVVADFDSSVPSSSVPKAVHLIYCGAASYLPLINFVIQSFDLAQIGQTQLHLVLGGKAHEIAQAKKVLERASKQSSYRLFTNVPHRDIAEKLAAASGLLIPVRPSIQDAARFPHKVGEYLASGTPLVTTAFGEIPQYLEDGKTAYITDAFDQHDYATKIEELIFDLPRAHKIGLAGRKKGMEAFDYKLHGERLAKFLEDLVSLK